MIHKQVEATDTRNCAPGFYPPILRKLFENFWKLWPVKGFEKTPCCDRNPLRLFSLQRALNMSEIPSWPIVAEWLINPKTVSGKYKNSSVAFLNSSIWSGNCSSGHCCSRSFSRSACCLTCWIPFSARFWQASPFCRSLHTLVAPYIVNTFGALCTKLIWEITFIDVDTVAENIRQKSYFALAFQGSRRKALLIPCTEIILTLSTMFKNWLSF